MLKNANNACQCRGLKKLGFDPCVGKSPWRRSWQPTPAFLPGELHGQGSLAGYSPRGRSQTRLKRLSTAHSTCEHTHTVVTDSLVVWQNPTRHCKASVLRLKNKDEKQQQQQQISQ